MTKEEGQEEIAKIERETMNQKREYVTLKRQRRLIEEDMLEETPLKKADEAYSISIGRRIRIATALSKRERNLKKHIQDSFRAEVEKYYGVVERNKGNKKDKYVYCVVTKRWYPSAIMKAAHIVPKALESEELSHLFGAPNVNLSDPRNGKFTIICLCSVLCNS